MKFQKSFQLSTEVLSAQRSGKAVVALESTVITHGLPRPQNLNLAIEMEEAVRSEGATPATIAVLDGQVRIGLEKDELSRLANDENSIKLSSRDIAPAVASGKKGGTTVAATLRIASLAGLHVFATGGMGGVHRGSTWDVSADLGELAKQAVLLVCAGAKSILDIPATLEKLETNAVPVIGYKTNKFPSFYSTDSGLSLKHSVSSPKEAANLAKTHWQMDGKGIVLAQSVPTEMAIPANEVEGWTAQAMKEAESEGIEGQAVSPFLLQRISQISQGKSIESNVALLLNNARLAAKVAVEMTQSPQLSGLLPKSA